jgi:hypothetical protein
MSRLKRRVITGCLLLGYLLVVTAAQEFHDHGGHRSGNGEGRAVANPTSRGTTLHQSACSACGIVLPRGTSVGSAGELDDDDCAVCQCSSHKSSPATPFQAVHYEPLWQQSHPVQFPFLESDGLLPERSRAPPGID